MSLRKSASTRWWGERAHGVFKSSALQTPESGLRLVPGPRVHTEVAFETPIPRFVVAGVQVHPLFVGHLPAPLEERTGIGSDQVAELPCPALDDLHDLLGHHSGGHRIFQRGREKSSEPRTLPVG